MSNKTEAGPVAEWMQSPVGNYPMLVWHSSYIAEVGAKLYAHPPAQEHPNLACKSVQKRLATQWGYVPAQEQPAPAVPQGWKLVPEEPTKEMVEATGPDTYWQSQFGKDWAKAIAAAPTHPTPAEREEPGCRSPAQDLMLCPNSACGWMGRCLAAEPFQPAERAEQPLPLLVRDIAAELGVTPLDACKALKTLGLGDYSVNMAVTATMARALRQHFAEQPPRDAVQQGLPDEQIDALWRQAASADGFTTAQFVREFARAIERATLKGQP